MRRIEGRIWNKGKSDFIGTGVQTTNLSWYNTIDIDRFDFLKRGFAAIPKQEDANYSGMHYGKISFLSMNAFDAIYIDEWLNVTDKKNTWHTETQINGGLISAHHGIYVDREHFQNIKNADWLNGNVYRNITFLMDSCESAVTYLHCISDRFHNIAFQGNPSASAKYFDLEECTNLKITSVSNIPYTRIVARDGVYNTVIDACITDNGINTQLGTYRMVMFPDSTWNHGESTKFVTSRIQPYNAVKTIEVKDNTPFKVSDLFEFYPLKKSS